MNKQRVVLAMSGGVDSSVAAHLLLQQGYEVVGVFMRHGHEETTCDTNTADGSDASGASLPIVDPRTASKQGCCTATDALDARRVADRLEIPFYALNLEAEFGRIIDYFVDEYSAGRTPNPCVMCNNWVKFGKLFDYADQIDAQFVATGHYARLTADSTNGCSTWSLRRGQDAGKDQSYVLFGIAADRLPRMLLPVGGFEKSEIRRVAEQLGLRVADKPDSQEICFVASGQHAPFVRRRRGVAERKGEIVTTDGSVVGTHAGVEGFTIGQRKGLGVAMGERYFVVRIDAERQCVVIGQRNELARRELVAHRTNWLADTRVNEPFPCSVQIRYNSQAQPAYVTRTHNDRIHVRFHDDCFGVAPGQAVVCYDDDRVLGGGWII